MYIKLYKWILIISFLGYPAWAQVKFISEYRCSLLANNEIISEWLKYYHISSACKRKAWRGGPEYEMRHCFDSIKSEVERLENGKEGALLCYNPYKSRFLYDGPVSIEDSDALLYPDVDQNVWLYDAERMTQEEVYMTGPGGHCDSYCWITNNKFVLMGSEYWYTDTLTDRDHPPRRLFVIFGDASSRSLEYYWGPMLSHKKYEVIGKRGYYKSREVQRFIKQNPKLHWK